MADFNLAIEIDPNDAVCYVRRSELKDKLGDVEGAKADFQKAGELDRRFKKRRRPRG